MEIPPSGINRGSKNVAMVELRTHLAAERVRVVALCLRANASEFYPNRHGANEMEHLQGERP